MGGGGGYSSTTKKSADAKEGEGEAIKENDCKRKKNCDFDYEDMIRVLEHIKDYKHDMWNDGHDGQKGQERAGKGRRIHSNGESIPYTHYVLIMWGD